MKQQKDQRTICLDLRPLETSNRYRGFGYYIYNLVFELIKIIQQFKSHPVKNSHPELVSGSNDSGSASGMTNDCNFVFLLYSRKNPLFQLIKKYHHRFIIIGKPKLRPRLWWLADQWVLWRAVKKIAPAVFVSLDTNVPVMLILEQNLGQNIIVRACRELLMRISRCPRGRGGARKINIVVTIHDLIPWAMAKEYQHPPDLKLRYFLQFHAAARADKIVTISQHSKKDIQKYLGVPPKKIRVIYEAVDERFKPINRIVAMKIRAKFSAGRPYFLMVGDFFGIDPRKNYLFALKCFAEIIQKQCFKSHLLLLVGQAGGTTSEYSKIMAEAKKIGILKNIGFTNFVSESDLARLFGAAEVFFYPSKYEGFGLPVLQAMASGCPVIAANTTSIPEVAGLAAARHKVDDEKDFLAKFEHLMRHRQRYIQAGLANIKRFSWQKCARETLGVIWSILS